MEVDVAQWDRKAEEKFKGLDGPIEIHVKHGIFIVPQSGRWPCYFVADEKHPIITRIRFNLLDCGARSRPCLDGRLHTDGRTDR